MPTASIHPVRSRELLLRNGGLVLLALLHLVGLVGFAVAPTSFRKLVPLHLLVSFAVWAAYQRTWTGPLVAWLTACGVLGFAAEVVGVRTGLIFGAYSYGGTLGWAVGGVPIMMAVNWALLVAVVGDLGVRLGETRHWGPTTRALLGSVLLVLLDSAMEPFSVAHDLWAWGGHGVPLRNYVGWALVSFLLLLPYHWHALHRENRSSAWVYLLQLGFFVGQLPWTLRAS